MKTREDFYEEELLGALFHLQERLNLVLLGFEELSGDLVDVVVHAFNVAEERPTKKVKERLKGVAEAFVLVGATQDKNFLRVHQVLSSFTENGASHAIAKSSMKNLMNARNRDKPRKVSQRMAAFFTAMIRGESSSSSSSEQKPISKPSKSRSFKRS